MRLAVLVAVPLALGLAACSGTPTTTVTVTQTVKETPAATTSSATPPASPSPSATPSSSPSSTVAPLVVNITCYGSDYGDMSYTDYHDAWSSPTDDCEGEWVSGKGTPAQREAAAQLWTRKSATKVTDRKLISALENIVASCAQNGSDTYDYIDSNTQDPAQHIIDWSWQFKFCPDHPDRKIVMKRLRDEEAAQAANPWFYGGGRVGKDFPAGTYVTKGNDGGCYWELTDSSGNITSNNFSSSPRMKVTIPSSAYAFSSEDCNKWTRA